jgi:DNA helicase-2/ATP-dependent DNA helicase PcrA
VAEERRLLYVAMTRAKQHLQLMVPLRFHVSQQHRLGDRHLYGGLSRFIPPEVAACFERVADAGAAPADAIAPAASAMPALAAGRLDLGSAWD